MSSPSPTTPIITTTTSAPIDGENKTLNVGRWLDDHHMKNCDVVGCKWAVGPTMPTYAIVPITKDDLLKHEADCVHQLIRCGVCDNDICLAYLTIHRRSDCKSKK